MTEQTDLKRLAEEAAKSAYNPRAKRCWWWFSHQWTMWELSTRYSCLYRRRCIRCGRPQEKLFF